MEDQASHIQDLVNRCLAGDREAYYGVYKLYHRSMYNVGFRIVRDQAEAEDVLQEAFISVFKNLHHYRADATLGAWIKRIVVNKAINQVKKRKMERIPDDDRWDVKEEEPQDEFEGYPFTLDAVKKGIAALPEGYRLVLSLYLIEGYDHSEIGEILGITESTSKSQFNRSKKKLREILEDEHYER